MKYIKLYENFNYKYKIGDYVKLVDHPKYNWTIDLEVKIIDVQNNFKSSMPYTFLAIELNKETKKYKIMELNYMEKIQLKEN